MGRGGSVSIKTRFGLDGPRIESQWGGEIFRTRPDRPRGPPSLLYKGYRVFPGGKATGPWRWPPIPSSAEVKERVELYLYSPSGPSWPVIGWNLPLPLGSVIVRRALGLTVWQYRTNDWFTQNTCCVCTCVLCACAKACSGTYMSCHRCCCIYKAHSGFHSCSGPSLLRPDNNTVNSTNLRLCMTPCSLVESKVTPH